MVGYEGLYEVSTTGAVRGLDRVASDGRRISGRVLKPFADNGYWWVNLYQSEKGHAGRGCKRSVHSLMLETFVGPRQVGMESLHNDGDGFNDTLSNLRWGTKSENRLDSVRHGTHAEARKVKCPKGHHYTPENIYRQRNGARVCKRCVLDRQREQRERLRSR